MNDRTHLTAAQKVSTVLFTASMAGLMLIAMVAFSAAILAGWGER